MNETYLHVSLQLLQESGVLVQPHEGLTQAGGQGEDAWDTGPLTLHELVQLLAVTHTHIGLDKKFDF